MDEETMCYAYERFTITTFQDDGMWWARARLTEKEAGGDRPVVGGNSGHVRDITQDPRRRSSK